MASTSKGFGAVVLGTLVDIFGAGLLCTGKSSVGKSEAVLGLIERGHRLVADDMVRVRRTGDTLTGAGDTLTRYHMEIRGLGMINIANLYGVRSTKESMKIDLEVRLVAWSETQPVYSVFLFHLESCLCSRGGTCHSCWKWQCSITFSTAEGSIPPGS